MGYLIYRIFKDVTMSRLIQQVTANLNLYEPGTVGREIEVTALEGEGCSALLMGYLRREEAVLMPVGYQLGGIWMDVRYQDGDWWDLTIYKGVEHQVSHSVNPWAHDDEYNQQHVDYRMAKVCALWPDKADRIRRYLLPWREPVTKLGKTSFVPRSGKAYPTDQHDYGDAEQIHDLVAAFGITSTTKSVVVTSG
jgi:hypothetical protein